MLALLSGSAILSVVIYGIVLVLVVLFAQWVIWQLGLPSRIAQVVVVLIGVLALAVFLRVLLPVLGLPAVLG
jgi:hypothetical protein